MNKTVFRQIQKEYVDSEKSSMGYFLCNRSSSFHKLWYNQTTKQEIVKYANLFLEEKKIINKVNIEGIVLFTYTKEFENSFCESPHGIKLRNASYRTLRLDFLDWIINKLPDETFTTI